MGLSLTSVNYSNGGAPMLVADAAQAQYWAGPNYDGGGVIVEYGGDGVEKLPKEFSQTKKPTGKRQKKFSSLDEAIAFESALLKQFLRLHPKAAKNPTYPGHPMYEVDGEDVFGIERRFTSPLASVTKKLKGDVSSMTFDKKNRAQGLFFETEGGGSGLVGADSAASALVVAKAITSNNKNDERALVADLERTAVKKIKPLGQITLGEIVAVFDAAYAAVDLAAAAAAGAATFADRVAKALKSSTYAPLTVRDQQAPAGAVFRVKPGPYTYGVVRDQSAGGTTYNALWVWR